MPKRPGRPLALTIGVHGWTLGAWLDALARGGAGAVLDVRQRRGVRGREYAWANARRLQEAVAAAGLRYLHLPELAPTTELRELQYREDARRGEGKRSRSTLAPAYAARYEREILDAADLRPVLAELPAALLCVEREPAACHRSLVAARLEAEHGVEVSHLLPGS